MLSTVSLNPNFMKIMLSRQRSLKNPLYDIEYRENPTKGLVSDSRSPRRTSSPRKKYSYSVKDVKTCHFKTNNVL